MENLQNESSLINYRGMKETDMEVLDQTQERSQPALTCSKSIIETTEQGEICSKLTIAGFPPSHNLMQSRTKYQISYILIQSHIKIPNYGYFSYNLIIFVFKKCFNYSFFGSSNRHFCLDIYTLLDNSFC